MYILPELLMNIASNLDAQDLSSFRLVSQDFAAAGLALIPKNGLSIMNTHRDLNQCRKLLECNTIAQNVRHLRLFHAEWPQATSQEEWEQHPLLFGGRARFSGVGVSRSNLLDARNAFTAYKAFWIEESSRRYSDDVVCLFRILESLPNLQSFEISHMQNCIWRPATNSRYQSLLKTIWVSPSLSNDVSQAVEMSLLALGNDFSKLQRLTVLGTLNPMWRSISPLVKFPFITNLSVDTFRISENEASVRGFLSLFPNLTHLSLNFQGFAPSIQLLGFLSWPLLQKLHINGMWTSEQEYLKIFKEHVTSLQQFIIGNSALTEGSWRSLFTLIRDSHSSVNVVARGELYGRSSRETINMFSQESVKLAQFMQNENTSWPFGFSNRV